MSTLQTQRTYERCQPHQTATVWILTILFRGGSEVYVFPHEELAREQLAQYAVEYWDDHADPDVDLSKLHREEIISMYFNGNEEESYTLVEEELLDKVLV